MPINKVIHSDLPFNLSLNQFKDIPIAENKKAIKQSLLNILNTTKNTRYLNPDFGCNVMYYLFEPFTEETAEEIGKNLLSAINQYEPRVKVIKINIDMDEKQKLYTIELNYFILEEQETDILTFSLQAM